MRHWACKRGGFGASAAGGQRRLGRAAQRRRQRLDSRPAGRIAAMDEPHGARRPEADDLEAIEIGALPPPVGESEQRRKRRALTRRGEVANGLEAGRAHVGAGSPLRRAAERERLIAQAMAFRQQKQRARINLVDTDRMTPPPAWPARRDQIERLFIELD